MASAAAGGVACADVGTGASAVGRCAASGDIAFNDSICDFRTSVFPPSSRWTTIRSDFTSTSLPDTLVLSLLVTVTSVPSGYVSLRVQPARPRVSASRIVRCFIRPHLVDGLRSAIDVPSDFGCRWTCETRLWLQNQSHSAILDS